MSEPTNESTTPQLDAALQDVHVQRGIQIGRALAADHIENCRARLEEALVSVINEFECESHLLLGAVQITISGRDGTYGGVHAGVVLSLPETARVR